MGTLVLLAILWVWIFAGRVPLPRTVAVLLILKVVVGGPLLVDHGFLASYFANESWRPPHERSSDFLRLPVTRIDDRLEFRAYGRSFPLYFFNDSARFNYYSPSDPDWRRLPLSVEWTGWIRIREARMERFHLGVPPPTLHGLPRQWTDVHSPDFLFWVQRYAPGSDPNDAPVRERYTAETGLGAQRTDGRNAGRDLSGARFLGPDIRRATETPQGSATLSVDGQPVVALTPAASRADGEVHLTRGWHRLDVRYANPYGAPREITAGWRDRVLSARFIYTRLAPAWRVVADRAVRGTSYVLDAVLLSALAAWVSVRSIRDAWRLIGWVARRRGAIPGREAVGLAAAVTVAVVVLAAQPLTGVTVHLTGGNDWLTHETLARDIAINGPLMTRGKPLGQGAPFSTQPLYPYFLAGVHLLIGEDLWGVYVVQKLLLGAMVFAVGRLAATMFGNVAGWLALTLAGYFALVINVNAPPENLLPALLGESLFLPLLAGWLLALARVSRGGPPRAGAAACAGVVGGLAVATRSPLLLAVPFVLLLVGSSWYGRWGRIGLARAAVLTACLLAVIATATARNVIVSRQAVLISSAGPVNLFVGNMPPPDVDVSRAETRPIYTRFGVDPLVRRVIEFAVQAPGRFAGHLAWKLRFVLGLEGRGPEERLFVFLWLSALAGLMVLLRRPELRGDVVSLAPAVVAVSHLLVMVVVGNFTYGYRLVYPFYLALLPYSALAFASLRPRSAPPTI